MFHMDEVGPSRRDVLRTGSAVFVGGMSAGCIGDINLNGEQENTDNQDDSSGPVRTVESVNGDTVEDEDNDDNADWGESGDDNTDWGESDDETDDSEQTGEGKNLGHLQGISGQTYPADTEGYLDRQFEWSAVGSEWTYETEIPQELEPYYEDRFGRSQDFARYASDWYGNPIIENLTSEFEQVGNESGLSDREVVELVMAFVQQLEYTSDEVTASFDQYTSYPVETLINRGGDCEDTVILLAAVLREMGYGCILLALWDAEPAHMALGVRGDPSIPGTYYEYEGDPYYYVETTGEGWGVGEMPEYENTNAELIEIPETPTMVYEWETRIVGNSIVVEAHITNVSDVSALNPQFSVAFENRPFETNRAYAETAVGTGFLSGDTTEFVSLELEPPDDETLRVRTTLTLDGQIHDMDVSEWQSAPTT